MDLLSSIKSDKTYTFSYWRYRALHWFWGVDPKSPEESPLPEYFYSHYCPLFHFTNLVVLFSPIIIIVKFLWVLIQLLILFGKKAGKVFRFLLEKLEAYNYTRTQRIREQQPKTAKKIDTNSEEYKNLQKSMERKDCLCVLLNYDSALADFGRFKSLGDCLYLSDEELQELWTKYAQKIKNAKELKELRKNKIRAWVVFFVNFSRIFIKGLLNTIYVLLALGIGWVLWQFGLPAAIEVGSFFWWVSSEIFLTDWFWVCRTILYVLAYIVVVVLLAFSLIKFGKWTKLPFSWLWQKTLPPFNAVGDAISSFFSYVDQTRQSVGEFIQMFYEENCPKIKIVAEDSHEAEIAKNLGDE